MGPVPIGNQLFEIGLVITADSRCPIADYRPSVRIPGHLVQHEISSGRFVFGFEGMVEDPLYTLVVRNDAGIVAGTIEVIIALQDDVQTVVQHPAAVSCDKRSRN